MDRPSGQRLWKVRVPASSANLGPGFDAVGLALGIYLDATSGGATNFASARRDETQRRLQRVPII